MENWTVCIGMKRIERSSASGWLPSLERLEQNVRAQEGSLFSFLVWPLVTIAWNTGGSNHRRSFPGSAHELVVTGGGLQVESQNFTFRGKGAWLLAGMRMRGKSSGLGSFACLQEVSLESWEQEKTDKQGSLLLSARCSWCCMCRDVLVCSVLSSLQCSGSRSPLTPL